MSPEGCTQLMVANSSWCGSSQTAATWKLSREPSGLWRIQDPQELGPKLKTRTASSSFNGQPISAYVSLLPLPLAAEYPDQAHHTPTSLILLAASSFIYALYKCTQKSPTNKQQTACVCADFSAFVHGFMPWAWLHFWRWNRVHTSLFHRLASSIVLSDVFRCLQMSSDVFRCLQMSSDVFRCLQIATKGHGHSGNHEFCTSAWVGNVERSTNSGKKPWTEAVQPWKVLKWVCLKMLCTPLYPMVFMIIIPIKWLFHWEYTLFSDKPTSWTSWNNNLKGKQPGVCCAFQALPTKAAQQGFLPLPDPVSQNGSGLRMSGGILRNPTCGRSGSTKREYFDGESWDTNQPANGN